MVIVTSLIENSRREDRPDLMAEHGLSVHIDLGDRRVLFDTGASEAFGYNARRLDLDLATVDHAVISHHHFDHGGGLDHFLAVNDHAPVYLKPLVGRHVFRFFGLIKRPIGLDEDLLKRHRRRFEYLEQRTEIAPDVFVLTDIDAPHPTPGGNRYIHLQREGRRVPDTFEHELMLVVRDQGHLVVFTGCAHSGILNMLETTRREFPDEPIRALFGGFHLVGLPLFNSMDGSRRDVRSLAEKLEGFGVEHIYTGHCTGLKAYSVLSEVLGERLSLFSTGTRVTVH